MNSTDLMIVMGDKSLKGIARRALIIKCIEQGELPFTVIEQCAESLSDKDLSVILEAMEELSRGSSVVPTLSWLYLAEKHINSPSNSLKREASRVVGNIAHLFPEELSDAISALKINTQNEGTVIRWAAAYALAKIVVIEQYAINSLYDFVVEVCESEQDNAIKNQYIKAIKKASKQQRNKLYFKALS